MSSALRNLFRVVGCLMLCCFAWSGITVAQQDKAAMVGTITDAKHAAVAGAKVTVRHASTGYSFDAVTNDQGRYETPQILPAGDYTVEVSAPGFKTATSQVVTLQIGDIREVNVTLEVGSVSEKITVTAEAPLLNTESSETGAVISGREIVDLPLKDRNFTSLATLTPGVSRTYVGVLTDATAFNQGDFRFGQGDVSGSSNNAGSSEASRFSRSGGASISVNGLRPTNNNFSLDGVDNNEPQFGTIGVFPNPDAIQEFKVETSVAKAEEGRGGATINTIYQSGTNDIHGSLYYYGQNDALNATNWELLHQRANEIAGGATPQKAAQDLPKSRIRVNEFGFTAGGPIIKNKTFFFADYLGQRNATPNTFQTVVPTAKSRTGDFSEFQTSPRATPLGTPAGNCTPDTTGFLVCPSDLINLQSCATPGVTSYTFPNPFDPNPAKPTLAPALNCQTYLQQTGQNAIPSTMALNQQALKFFALYPLPTVNVLNPNNSPGQYNFFGTRADAENIDSFDVKIDHNLTNKNRLYGRYTRDNQERVRANFFPKVPTAGFGAGDEVGNTRQVVVNDVHTFNPTVLNEFKFGWTQVEIGIKNCGVEGACEIGRAHV